MRRTRSIAALTLGAVLLSTYSIRADVKSDDSSEWGSERVSGTAFNIWDKKPNT